MKITNLRKIIRESIKQLVSEQGSMERCIQISSCWGANTRYRKAIVNGGVPQVGQVLDWTFMGRTWFITTVSPASTCNQGVMNIGLNTSTTCCPHLCGTTVPNISSAWWVNNPNYSMTGMNNVGCSGNGPMCCGNPNYNPIQTSSNSNFTAIAPQGTSLCGPSTPPCDTSPASACAVQWFQNPNANWAANWITNRDCTNYNWPSVNLPLQATAIMANAPTPQTGPFNNASDIWAAGNASGLPQQQRNQFVGKMAKGQYSLCQKQACNC